MKNLILLFALCATASVFAADNDRFIVDGKEILAQSGGKMQRATTTGNADGDFAKLMMMHHQSGIDLANRYLSVSTDKQMRKLAEKMLIQHTEELADLQDRSQALTAVPASYSETEIDSTQDGSDKKKDKDKDTKATNKGAEQIQRSSDPATTRPEADSQTKNRTLEEGVKIPESQPGQSTNPVNTDVEGASETRTRTVEQGVKVPASEPANDSPDRRGDR